MNEDLSTGLPHNEGSARERLAASVGSSTLLNLLEAMIQLSERNKAEHKVFTQELRGARDTVKENYNAFAGDMQKAFQQMRKEFHGEKRISLALLNELLELGQDMEQITAARPKIAEGMTAEEVQAVVRWADAVEVQSRKVQAALLRHGIHPYDAVVGSAYDPKLHERIGTRRVEGMGPLLVAEQQQCGYASQQPEFVLRRPQVYVTE
jgi:molecular chaperone GrpE (heat shock protein)